MTPEEYIQAALRTEPKEYKFPATGDVSPRIEHAILGIATEAGELLDALKKAKIYGKKLDTVNLIEELGDLQWYAALLINALNTTFENVHEINIAKLKARFPEKFTEEKALNRDLQTERKILEQ